MTPARRHGHIRDKVPLPVITHDMLVAASTTCRLMLSCSLLADHTTSWTSLDQFVVWHVVSIIVLLSLRSLFSDCERLRLMTPVILRRCIIVSWTATFTNTIWFGKCSRPAWRTRLSHINSMWRSSLGYGVSLIRVVVSVVIFFSLWTFLSNSK